MRAWNSIYINKIVLLQEASVRALKMSGGRFEAALEFLPKQQQQQQQQQQNEPVNGMSKGPSSGKLLHLRLLDLMCKLTTWSRIVLEKLVLCHVLKKLVASWNRMLVCMFKTRYSF